MTTSQKRTLTITCADGDEVTKKQLTCFVHNLITDTMRKKPLIIWKRDPKAAEGSNAYYTHGLAEGTLITLRGTQDKPGAEMTYSRHGKQILNAVEHFGDVNCDMHMTSLLHRVTCAVTWAEAIKKPNPLAQLREDIDKKYQKPQKDLTGPRVGDLFRKVTADQIATRILRNPSMLSINVAENSPEFARLETLIRAVVGYIQAVRPKQPRYYLKGSILRSVTGDHRICNPIVLSNMVDVASALAELDSDTYGGLKPAEQTEKFVADVVSNMLIGI